MARFNPSRQAGFVMVTALILLTILAVAGIVAMRGSLFAERISANDRDRMLARENAELALRDAERDILGKKFDGTFCGSGSGCRALGARPQCDASITGSTPCDLDARSFWSTGNLMGPTPSAAMESFANLNGGSGNTKGMYLSGSQTACGKPLWSGANWGDSVTRTCAGTITSTVPVVDYGAFTGAPAISGVTQPQYLVEMFTGSVKDNPGTPGVAGSKMFFRITAVGYGRSILTGSTPASVTLQSVFSPL